jgi:Biopolymer transport protein ExbD/TolR
VPPGLGGDVVFRTDGHFADSRIIASGSGRLTTFQNVVRIPSAAPGRPSAGRAIQPTDFTGRYTLSADGQWSGSLELIVDADGKVSGQFRSDKNGTVYGVTGAVAVDNPQKLTFTIQFPRSKQTFEGLLWTEGKDVIAGTLTMLEHAYSFVAVREGGSLFPDDLLLDTIAAVKSPSPPLAKRKQIVVRLGHDANRIELDGVSRAVAELEKMAAQMKQQDSGAQVLLWVEDTVPFERVRSIVRVLRSAGLESIKLSLGEAKDDTR